MTRSEVHEAIKNMLPYCNCIAWGSFRDAPCYYNYKSLNEAENAALAHALVLETVPKYGKLHNDLAREIAAVTGNVWVTYDWVIKAVSRWLLTAATCEEPKSMAGSRKVKEGSKME